MKPTNATLTALLGTRQFMMARLYTITLVDGTILRYCGGDQNIVSGANTYSCGGQTGPYFEKIGNKPLAHWKVGLGSDTLIIDVMPGSLAWQTLARVGYFDGADFQMDYAFMSTYGTVAAGCQITVFKGRVAELDVDRNLITFNINDYRELFDQQLPRNLFAASCANTLYDAQCTVVQVSFQVNGTVLAGSTSTSLLATLAQATGYFDLGKLTWVLSSGGNFGSIGVSQYILGSPSTIVPIVPFSFTPQAGDTFILSPGCDRTFAGGCTKFSNTANFRGEPYIPAPETAL